MSTATPAPDAGFVVSGPDVCADCLTHQGLCERHEKHVLPQLAQPHWYRLVGTDYQKPAPESDEARRIRERKARKAHSRLLRGINGGFSRSAKVAA